ncbi:NIPSNAP family protein [Kribbella sp. NPDC051587]|uniref:NIPSNAP family protein n=1 Tax=Kribbella sp. NPDC051587 TaxID=3364119 RepID=UPI0037924386
MVDLRQYTLHPGQRDTLIDLFDEHFVEGQEVCGMHIPGQFRDLDDPDRFVWLRGFRSLDVRAEALKAFYYGPTWRAHAEAANATMVDSDNALLLEPIQLGPDYPQVSAPRTSNSTPSVITGMVHPAEPGFEEHLIHDLLPTLGVAPLAIFRSLSVPNNFPALPLRDDTVLVWFARSPDEAAYRRWEGQVLRLAPTSRSQLH